MEKFAFIGAGSFIFTRNLVRDLLSFPAFEDCELALMDTDPERLERITAAVRKINAAMGAHAKITPTQSRAEALSGADGVLCTVFNGGIDVWRYDIEIPMQFGVDINIGDTRSVSGIFRALRNIPLMLDITREVVKAVNIPVTVKTRLGWDADNRIIVDLAEQLQDCGIAALSIHGRTRAQMYTGEADWTLIGEAKNNPRIQIPIIGNGDVTSAEICKIRNFCARGQSLHPIPYI